MSRGKRRLRGALLGLFALLCACGPAAARHDGAGRANFRFSRRTVDEALASAEAGVRMGTFRLADGGIVDGDTIKVEGLDASLRLLAIDTEETFKSKADRALYAQGFSAYLRKKAAQSKRPVKTATPMGEAAKAFAERFFQGVTEVELERDHPLELRGRYGRYLAYVFVRRGGKRLHYNVEAVRAGMAPYFPKYGHARRYRADFEAAMAEARAAGRGIWNPETEHYPDYETRLAWWYARGDFVDAFEAKAESRDDHIVLGRYQALERLAAREGKDVHVLGTVAKIVPTRGDPVIVYLAHRRGRDLPVVFYDPLVFEESRIARYEGEYVVIHGPVQRYRDRKRKKTVFQVVVRRSRQVTLPPYDPPGPTPVPAAGEHREDPPSQAAPLGENDPPRPPPFPPKPP